MNKNKLNHLNKIINSLVYPPAGLKSDGAKYRSGSRARYCSFIANIVATARPESQLGLTNTENFITEVFSTVTRILQKQNTTKICAIIFVGFLFRILPHDSIKHFIRLTANF